MSDWQPIETAPKDTKILVASCKGFAIAEYDSDMSEWYSFCEGAYCYDCQGSRSLQPNPSHWLPLELPSFEKISG